MVVCGAQLRWWRRGNSVACKPPRLLVGFNPYLEVIGRLPLGFFPCRLRCPAAFPPAVSVDFMQPTGSHLYEGAACHVGIHSWGFDACAVEQALLLTGGNEERAVDLILDGGFASSAVQLASRAPAARGAGADHAAKRSCYSHHASDSARESRRRSHPHLIDTLVAQRVFLFGFQTSLKQLQAVFPCHFWILFPDHVTRTALNRFPLQSRVLLVTQGRLCTMLAQRLLCVQGQRALLNALRHATSTLSRRHISDNSAATCVATLKGHSRPVTSVAFHPTAPLLATSSEDSTVKLWRLYSNNSSATCVATLKGHKKGVSSVAFHPTAPLLATGSHDHAMKLWRLSSDNSSATCVATLAFHSETVGSVAFHPTAPLLATGSHDSTVRLWKLSPNNSSATCLAILYGHSHGVTSIAFHPTAPLLATGSQDSTVKLWRLSSDNSSATCVATLLEHIYAVRSVAFHPTLSLLATGSNDTTVKLWRLSSDNSSIACVATLAGHLDLIYCVAFHHTAPLLATSSNDRTVRLWRLSSNNSSATCVATLVRHHTLIIPVAFHPTAPLLATGSQYGNVRLWR